ncbi:unnamed protein product [Boreogadus saida]
MSSWVVRLLLLLGALAAAHVRLGSSEGDPLPSYLVDLVWNSPIASLDDLMHLFRLEAGELTEGEEEEQDTSDHHPGRFTRSLNEAPKAIIAECKVRTEVQEVTRAMHDLSNAHFMLWPPCVEVQRCSGCCNSQIMHCVPTITSTRDLEVVKIQYLNSKPQIEKVIVSVEDHLSCRCEHRAHPRAILPPSQPQPQPLPLPQPYPQPYPQPHPQPHATPPKSSTSKAELHRHDDQKHNQQQFQTAEEREPPATRQWPQGGYTQLARWTPGPGDRHAPPLYTLAAGAAVPRPVTEGAGGGLVWAGARALGPQGSKDIGPPPGSGSEGGARDGAGLQHQQPLAPRHHNHPPHHPHYPHHPQYPQYGQRPDASTHYRLNSFQGDSASTPPSSATWPANHRPEWNPTPSPASTNQKEPALQVASGEHGRVDNDRQTETGSANHSKGSDKEESGSTNSGEGVVVPANRRQDKDSGVTDGGPALSEEERRQKLLEIVQREPHPPHPHPADHLPQHRPKPTASKAVVSLEGPTRRPPSTAARTPRRPAAPRRRRKHRNRNRISKKAMRAIIM